MVEAAAVCGCFYCVTRFPPTAISDWVDESSSTALCPNCGIDSVIPEQREKPLSDELLTAMHDYWFERTVSLSPQPSLRQRLRLRLEPLLRRLTWDWGRSKRDAV